MAGHQAAGTSGIQCHTWATEVIEPAKAVRNHGRASTGCYVFEIYFWISGNNTIVLSSEASYLDRRIGL